MMRDILDYFTSRAIEADRLAAVSIDPVVRATHESFAAAYRAHAGPAKNAAALTLASVPNPKETVG